MPRVVILGSTGFDLTIRLPRLPRPGETLLAGELHTGPGGKGANQAVAARKLGAEVLFLTALGDDDFGRRARENLETEAIDLSFAKIATDAANQVALIFVGESDGQNLIGVAPGASERLAPEDIEKLPESIFRAGDVLLCGLEIPLRTVATGLRRAKSSGMITVLNPAPVDRKLVDILSLVDLLTPNESEIGELVDFELKTLGDCVAAARVLIARGAGAAVLTRGDQGCVVVEKDRPAWSIGGQHVRAIDTVGAGDAFNGALAVALSARSDLLHAALRANAAGALAVEKPGAQGGLPTSQQVDELLQQDPITPQRLEF